MASTAEAMAIPVCRFIGVTGQRSASTARIIGRNPFEISGFRRRSELCSILTGDSCGISLNMSWTMLWQRACAWGFFLPSQAGPASDRERGESVKKTIQALILWMAIGSIAVARAKSDLEDPAATLADLVDRASEVKIETYSGEEYRQAAKSYRKLLEEVQAPDLAELEGDDAIDRDLLEAHLRKQLFELENLLLYQLSPVRYLVLSKTDSLFVRPCAQPDKVVAEARDELEKLPEILENARKNLTRPARTWTENAIYTCYYAEMMLEKMLPEVCIDDPELAEQLRAAGDVALAAVRDYATWLENDLLSRSDRSPAWDPEEVEFYQFAIEQLFDYGLEEMLRVAEEDEAKTLAEMEELAKRIHPSGDLVTVWNLMKEEAPPWSEVYPMAERYVALADEWLRGPGAHLVDIPREFDYGVQLTSPMGRRVLSFGGATYGPTLGGRISGYYVLTPLEKKLNEEEQLSRLKSYNPYWTHVISYHEWLGHNVQRAIAEAHASRPMRDLFWSSYLSQAWSFYLEKLLEDEGYYEDMLPHLEALKTRMARLQMRMWRIQRILTKLQMAKGEMTFDEAVEAYVEKIGMEPGNALIEVQRDSQSPSPPGREIIGERVILEMRAEYQRRMGEHYQIKAFHEALLRYGELPLPVVRQLMFGDY